VKKAKWKVKKEIRVQLLGKRETQKTGLKTGLKNSQENHDRLCRPRKYG
jgi:hypothetical protein